MSSLHQELDQLKLTTDQHESGSKYAKSFLVQAGAFTVHLYSGVQMKLMAANLAAATSCADALPLLADSTGTLVRIDTGSKAVKFELWLHLQCAVVVLRCPF